MDGEAQTYSIIVEMENASAIDWQEVEAGLSALAGEIECVTRDRRRPRPQVVLVHSGQEADTPLLERSIFEHVPRLGAAADLVFAALPDGRYYEMKNAGIKVATGDIVVLSDSDMVMEAGWLAGLLSPFEKTDTIAVNGYTYLGYDDFASRTFALIWLFPLRDRDQRFAAKRSLNANNCAFRRSWIAAHPFPRNNGFKVSCTLLAKQFRDEGHDFVRVESRSSHSPPRGFRFFFWRALVTGRDADRKYVALASRSRLDRVTKALRRWPSTSWRASRRVVGHAREIGMPGWQVPAALAIGVAFYTLAFFAQMAMALGLAADKVERLPDYVVHS